MRSLLRRVPQQIPIETLATGLKRSRDPELLRNLVRFSFEKLGFFPKTATRMYEYPWAIVQAGDVKNLRVLDVGAGVNALPLWFAEQRADVVTVDNHPVVRDTATRDRWNEWGYLDYSILDTRVFSVRSDVVDAPIEGPFDVIYSISVIEHVPAATRRKMIHRMAELSGPNCRLLLTLDLIPGTTRLWTFSEGQLVEDPAQHGSLDDFLSEVVNEGFVIDDCTVASVIPDSRTDVAYIVATRQL